MNERIQRVLDGELPADQLDPAESEVHRLYQEALESAGKPLAGLPEIDVSRAVMRRIRPAGCMIDSGPGGFPGVVACAAGRRHGRPLCG